MPRTPRHIVISTIAAATLITLRTKVYKIGSAVLFFRPRSVIRKMIFSKISPIRIMIRIAARFIPQSIILSTEKKSFHDPLVNAS